MPTNVLTGDALTFTSLRPLDLSNCTKSEIREYFENSYDLDESLFSALKEDGAFFKCPDRLRLPLIFYFGHTACVYVNKLILAGLLKPADRVDLTLETLMETGVDEMSWDDTENYRMGGKFQWPSVAEVVDYRRKVRELILKVIEETPLELPVTFDSPWWAVFMGMEHERIHIETSSVLIRQLPVGMVERPRGWLYAAPSTGKPVLENPMITVDESTVALGKPLNFPSYGWDNEYGNVEYRVPSFEASAYLVTNREFLQFMKAGGYTTRHYWTDEGWRWRTYRQALHPSFWVCESECLSACGADLASYSHCKASSHLTNGSNSHCNGHIKADDNGHQGKDEGGGEETEDDHYRLRLMFDVIPMPWDWPVEINYLEAKAFCAWKGPDYRLPTEAEWHAMHGKRDNKEGRDSTANHIVQRPATDGLSCDPIYQGDIKANFNVEYGSSTAVNTYPPNKLGFRDLLGNVWQWSEDTFNALPGSVLSSFYGDFSTPGYEGRHNVIMGGSWISTGNEASRFSRYAFRRHFLQHAGFRLVRSLPSGEGPVQLPVGLIKDQPYIQGTGLAESKEGEPDKLFECQEHPVNLPKGVEYDRESSRYIVYQLDTAESLMKQLRAEWLPEKDGGGDDGGGVLLASQPTLPGVVLAQWAAQAAVRHGAQGRTLYMGCGVGRGVAPLARHFPDIIAVDTRARFIDACIRLQAGGRVRSPDGATYQLDAETRADLAKVTFKQLTWLPNEVGFFDFVFSSNLDLIDFYPAFLLRMNEVIKKDSLFIVASGKYGEEELDSYLAANFTLLEKDVISVANGLTTVSKVTVWRHN